MNDKDNTPGIAAHLSTSLTVWDSSQQNRFIAGTHENFRRHAGTFFLNSNIASFNRHYFLGDLGAEFLGEGDAVYAGDDATRVRTDSPASADAINEIRPPDGNYTGSVRRHVVNTEEFLDYGRVLFPLQDIVAMDTAGTTNPLVTIACDKDGRLYTCGYVGPDSFNQANASANALGHGPGRWQTGVAAIAPNPQRVKSLRRVYGDSDAFSAVKFVKVATSGYASFALDEDGQIWMAGKLANFAKPEHFPENSTNIGFFRKREVTEWYDGAGVLQEGSLTFVDIVAGRRVNDAVLMALTDDGRVFICGTFFLGALRTTDVFTQMAGFVDSVEFTSQGNGNWAQRPTIEASPPDAPDGVQATFRVGYFGGNLVAYVDCPGWGYATPPTLTVVPAPGSAGEGATAECTLFDDEWRLIAVSKSATSLTLSINTYAAVTVSDKVYMWGGCGWFNFFDPTEFGFAETDIFEFQVQSPRYAFSYGGDKLVLMPLGGMMKQSETVIFWGINLFTPDQQQHPAFIFETNQAPSTNLRNLIDGSPQFADIACSELVGAALTPNGQVFTWGSSSSRLGHGSRTYAQDETISGVKYRSVAAISGQPIWEKLYSGERCILLVRRPEEVDEYGLVKEPLPPFEAE